MSGKQSSSPATAAPKARREIKGSLSLSYDKWDAYVRNLDAATLAENLNVSMGTVLTEEQFRAMQASSGTKPTIIKS